MSNIKVNSTIVLYPATSSTSGYHNSSKNKGSNKDSCSNQSFQDILKQKLENQVRPMADTPLQTLQVFFNRRPLY